MSADIEVIVNGMVAPVCTLSMNNVATVGDLKDAVRHTPEGSRLLTAKSTGRVILRLISGSRLLADDGCILATLLDEGQTQLELLMVCAHETPEIIAIREKGYGVREFLNPEVWDRTDEELRKACCNDKEAMMAALQQNAMCLEYASESLRADIDIATAAVRRSGQAIIFVAAPFKANRSIVLEALRRNGRWLEHASPDLQADKEVVLEALRTRGSALAFAKVAFADEQEIVLAAVRQDGLALEHGSPAMLANREIVKEAIAQNAMALQFADDTLKADKEIVLTAVSKRGLALQFASEALKADQEVVNQAVLLDPLAISYAHHSLKHSQHALT